MDTTNQPLALLIDNPDLSERLIRSKNEVKKLTASLKETINKTLSSDKYKKEIEEGTKKRQLLLEQGKYSRDASDERNAYDCFIPSKDTPTLNFIYFLNRDSGVDKKVKVLVENKEYNIEVDKITEILDEKFGKEFDPYEEKEKKNSAKKMENFIYENMDHDTFKTLKKLKTFAASSDSSESELAEVKCRRMCKKYNLDYDKIPTYYDE